MAIAATRMHRSLVDFASRSTDMYDIFHSFILRRIQVDVILAYMMLPKSLALQSPRPSGTPPHHFRSIGWS